MSDAVTIAVISNVTTILALAVTRWLSHQEHKGTASKLEVVHGLVNDRLDKAVKEIGSLTQQIAELKKP